MVARFGKSKKDILKFVKINSCSISSLTFVEISQFFLWIRKMICLTKIDWISTYSYLIETETNRERSKNSWNTIEITLFYLQNHVKSLDFKKYIANLVKHQKHCSYQNFFFVVAFSFKCIVEFFFNDLIAKLFVKIKRFANSEPNTNTVAPCTQQPKKLTEAQLILFWFINVV